MKRLPIECPSCGGRLAARKLFCSGCATEVEGIYRLPPLATLGEEDEEFVRNFVKCSGSLKNMANQMSVSYPTVRNRLDDVIARLKKAEKIQAETHE